MIEIPLTKGYVAIVDDEDADLLQYEWIAHIKNNRGMVYAVAKRAVPGIFKRVGMHRIILERKLGRALGKHELTDHIHGNKLDNRRSELRIANAQQSQQNRRMPRNNTTGYKGVVFDKKKQRFVAHIGYNNKTIHLGIFDTPEEAHSAYCEAAIKYHGEFAQFE